LPPNRAWHTSFLDRRLKQQALTTQRFEIRPNHLAEGLFSP